MPKVSFIKDPPVDILLAVCMERKQAKKLSFKDLAEKTGYSAVHMNRLFNMPSDEWTREAKKKICTALNVPKEYIPLKPW